MSKVDVRRDGEKRVKCKVGRKVKRDSKLQELEKQLQFAESRCGTLKQQLDYIKLLYGCRKWPNSELHIQCPAVEDGQGGGDTAAFVKFDDWTHSTHTMRVGRKEDGDGSELLTQAISPSNTSCTSVKRVGVHVRDEASASKSGKSQSKQKTHLKLLKVKKRSGKKSKRRRRADDTSSSKFSNVSSQTHSQIWQDPVVEIYKNSALNAESESGLEIVLNKKRVKASEVLSDLRKMNCLRRDCHGSREKVSGCDVETKPKRSSSVSVKKVVLKEEGIQTEVVTTTVPDSRPVTQAQPPCDDVKASTGVVKDPADPAGSVFETVKSYCQPTISSKRKQVERDIYTSFNNINVRNIPFIAARSTTPSHNIGVNIQQVLSIIKKRNLGDGSGETGASQESRMALLGAKKAVAVSGHDAFERVSEVGTAGLNGSDEAAKKRPEPVRTTLSYWKSSSDFARDKDRSDGREKNLNEETSGIEWGLKVDKLKKVLVFLHEDFTSLSHKYKKLQKKLTNRNISKTDAKGELADIEKELEKKEEEITVVIGLYKEVLNLRDDLKKLQDKYNLLTCGKALIFYGLKQSNSAHTQMTTLLRKIQNFQERLKG